MLDPDHNAELPPIPGKRYFTIGEVNTNVALDFDGVSEYVDLGTSMDLTGETTVTLEAWVYPEVISGNHKGIVNRMTGGSQFFMRLEGGTLQTYFYLDGGGHSRALSSGA